MQTTCSVPAAVTWGAPGQGGARLSDGPRPEGEAGEVAFSQPVEARRRRWRRPRRPATGTLPERIVSRLRRDTPLVVMDVAVAFVAYLVPLVLRFDGAVPSTYWSRFWPFLPAVICIHLAANHVFGLYGRMWRYASVYEARHVVFAGLTAGVVVVALNEILTWLGRRLPLSVAVSGVALALLGFGAIRFENRLFAFRRGELPGAPTRALLVGAGDAGATVLADIRANPSLGLDPVGFVDDDPRKIGLELHDVPVLGARDDIPSLVRDLGVDQVLLVIPSASSDLVRQVAGRCEEADVPLRVLPSIDETVGGQVSARDIRDLAIEDLLGRQQVAIDLEPAARMLRGRRVLVTGAGGSIGSEIARQVATFEPDTLALLDHDETHLHDVIGELRGTDTAEAVLLDIRDRDRVVEAFARLRPEVVFHAAAHKHVPILEAYPEEALLTNVLGTANLTDAALAWGVERFILISTDKAVKPVSVMGASKWLAEQLVRSVEGSCVFSAVRFGNVFGSRGSVIPTFIRQIERGGPVTVTDPSMCRYFMSTHEAVQLVLQAAALSTGGEVLTLRMGDPMNILELARRLIRLAGRVPGKDVPVQIVGCRPGEKLAEDLIDPDEDAVPSSHPGVMVSRPRVPDRPTLKRALRELEALAEQGEPERLAAALKAIARPPDATDPSPAARPPELAGSLP